MTSSDLGSNGAEIAGPGLVVRLVPHLGRCEPPGAGSCRSGVHVQIMQDRCIGTHMAMWFAASIPRHLYLPTEQLMKEKPSCCHDLTSMKIEAFL
ncbi:uncharacterized protein LOC141580079 isoform X2 [Saimiri boliviensis]|uniref:uncharacterized protein LOC141580079 isoform X2 n=1 Tax=Saimiri boliviensis TaxID=27679 RepID=UPI003D7803BC